MLGTRALLFVAIAALGCGSKAKEGGGSSGSSDSGTMGGDGGTGAVTNGASTSSDGSGTDASGASTNTGSGGSGAISNATSGEATSATTSNAATGSGGSGGVATSSTDGAGGSGGAASACPDTPPSAGSPCPRSGQICGYEDCDGVGRTVARCLDDSWIVETAPCSDAVYCQTGFGAEPCGYGQVCVVLLSGIAQQLCVENTCGDGPVSCDCIDGCYGECGVLGDAASGITISCNTCPSPDGCA